MGQYNCSHVTLVHRSDCDAQIHAWKMDHRLSGPAAPTFSGGTTFCSPSGVCVVTIRCYHRLDQNNNNAKWNSRGRALFLSNKLQ